MMVPERVGRGVFWGVHLLWLPALVFGYVLWVGKLILHSRHTPGSTTMLASFYPRWMMHQLRQRRDDACVRLMAVLPNVSQLGLHLFSAPTLLVHRLTGYVPRLYRYPYPGIPPMNEQPAARVTFFDTALARHLPDIEQLVILGAGLDTRSYRLPAGSRVRCFEVDAPNGQAFKRRMLQRAGIDASRVTFVPADFEQEDWYEKLIAAGFDPRKPSFFLWEAVTMYLDRRAVESTLRRIARTAHGSAVSFDYFSPELLGDQSLTWRYGRAVLRLVSEPFGTFTLDTHPPAREHVAAFVATCGLSLEEQRDFGQETGEQHPQAGFATAIA
jgi:methyltransferase (TIGR00027 family)